MERIKTMQNIAGLPSVFGNDTAKKRKEQKSSEEELEELYEQIENAFAFTIYKGQAMDVSILGINPQGNPYILEPIGKV